MDILTKVDIRGIEYPQDHIVTYKHTRPLDITMTHQGELVYCDSKSVKIVRPGNIKTLVTTPQGKVGNQGVSVLPDRVTCL